MNKSDLLKILEQIPDDADIVFLDGEGGFLDGVEIVGEKILGRFTHSKFPETNFYATHRHYENWVFLYARKCAILG